MDPRRERLEADGTCPAKGGKGRKLVDVAQPVGAVHQDAVLILHLGNGHRLIRHARDVHDAGVVRKQRLAMGQRVMERVVDQLEPSAALQVPCRLGKTTRIDDRWRQRSRALPLH